MGLGRDKDESLLEYQIRICSERVKLDLTWDEVAKILNKSLEKTMENPNIVKGGMPLTKEWIM